MIIAQKHIQARLSLVNAYVWQENKPHSKYCWVLVYSILFAPWISIYQTENESLN